MALTGNRQVDHFVDQELREVSVASGERIFKGGFVEWGSDGFARALTGSGIFAGLAFEEMDNSGGGDGDVSGRVCTLGDYSFSLDGAAASDVGRAVYAVDDEEVTFESSGNMFVGYVQSVLGSGQIMLRLGGKGPVHAERVEHCSGSVALSIGQSGTVFTNGTAAGVITLTLPVGAPVGVNYKFACINAVQLRVNPGPGSGIYIKGARQGDGKYVGVSGVGDFIHLVADGDGDWVSTASATGSEAEIAVES